MLKNKTFFFFGSFKLIGFENCLSEILIMNSDELDLMSFDENYESAYNSNMNQYYTGQAVTLNNGKY